MTETLRVLVTDDEEGMRRGIRRALERHTAHFTDLDTQVAFSVDTAASGEEALEHLQQQTYDLLLLDYKLPGMSGIDVLHALGGRESAVLTIMITAYASLHAAVEATRTGAYDFLPKPFTPEELLATVRKVTRHWVLQKRARELAAERQRTRFQLISVVSHELKAPLAAIEGYLRILQDEKLAPDTASRERAIGRSLARLLGMRKLIADLLDLTRIESGEKTRNPQSVDLVPLTRQALETVASEAAERGIGLELLGDSTIDLIADPAELEIVLNNLLTNSVKYNRDGGYVRVTLEADEQVARITVEDSGIGMTAAEQSRLFGEFVRIRNDQTRSISGSGLGLSILKRLAALYRGEVTVSSQPGVGSTFTVALARGLQPDPAGRPRS